MERWRPSGFLITLEEWKDEILERVLLRPTKEQQRLLDTIDRMKEEELQELFPERKQQNRRLTK